MHVTDDGCLRQMTNLNSRTEPVCNAKISWRSRELFSSQPAADPKTPRRRKARVVSRQPSSWFKIPGAVEGGRRPDLCYRAASAIEDGNPRSACQSRDGIAVTSGGGTYLSQILTPPISEANQISGSQTGSQRRQASGDAGRRPATIVQLAGTSGDARRRPATLELRLTSEGSLVRTQLRPPGQRHLSRGDLLPAWPGRRGEAEVEGRGQADLLAVSAIGCHLVPFPAFGQPEQCPPAQFLVHQQIQRNSGLRVLDRLSGPVIQDRIWRGRRCDLDNKGNRSPLSWAVVASEWMKVTSGM